MFFSYDLPSSRSIRHQIRPFVNPNSFYQDCHRTELQTGHHGKLTIRAQFSIP
ncbi:hypothetical protein YC2023_095438 [Brassica napus]